MEKIIHRIKLHRIERSLLSCARITFTNYLLLLLTGKIRVVSDHDRSVIIEKNLILIQKLRRVRFFFLDAIAFNEGKNIYFTGI